MERGWQINKSLGQCNQHMLDNQIGCDVTFEIQSPDGSSTTVPAHKYMLVSRSPVFEAMLYGPASYKEANDNIVITDIEPAVFKEMLRFMYTESCTITAHNVLFLMTAAKKYILDHLADQCTKYLEENLDSDNVCIILEHCHQQDENDLAKKCLEYLAQQAQAVLKTDAFLALSESTLCRFLECDDLIIDKEFSFYKACLKWAENKLKKNHQDVTDENLRDTLGKCIYQIRFHQMSFDEISDESLGFAEILTAKELNLLYVISHDKTSEKAKKAMSIFGQNFNQCDRKKTWLICHRFNTKPYANGWGCNSGHIYDITVKVDKPINLVGLGLFGGLDKDTHNCEIKILANDSIIYCEKETIISNGQSDPYQIRLKSPIIMHKDMSYIISNLVIFNQRDQNVQLFFSTTNYMNWCLSL